MMKLIKAIIFAFIVGGGIAAIFLSAKKNTEEPNNLGVPVEDRVEISREVHDAFLDPNAPVSVSDGMVRLMNFIGKEFSNEDGNPGMFFNTDLLIDELNRDGAIEKLSGKPDDPRFRRVFGEMLQSGVKQWSPYFKWDRTEIRAIRWLKPNREAVIICRHHSRDDDGEYSTKMRWWIVNTSDGWKAFDYEEISVGMRFSRMASTLILQASDSKLAKDPEFKRLTSNLAKMRPAFAKKQFAEVVGFLVEPLPAKYPPVMRSIWNLRLGQAFLGLSQNEKALEVLKLSDPDSPEVNLSCGAALSNLGKYEESLPYFEKYVAQMGNDANGHDHLGYALEKLNRLPEACAAYRKALDDRPVKIATLQSLRQCLPADQKMEIADRFLTLPKPDEDFDNVFDPAYNEGDLEGALAISTAAVERFPKNPKILYAHATMQSQIGAWEEAKKFYLRAIKATPVHDHYRYLYGYLLVMHDKKKSLEAYQSVDDADAVDSFQTLAQMAYRIDEKNERVLLIDLLESLSAAHEKRAPDDLALIVARADIQIALRHFDAAEALLAKAMSQPNGNDDRLREARVRALYLSGNGLTAYGKSDLSKKTFNQLAESYYRDRDADNLEKLLAIHLETDPEDDHLTRWQGELHFLRGDHEKAAKAFLEFQKSRPIDDKVMFFDHFDHLVRSLLRTNQYDKARKTFEKYQSVVGPLIPAIVEAATGDVERTEAMLEKLVESGSTTDSFYADPDLGPGVRGERFGKWREKHPPPKDERPLRKT